MFSISNKYALLKKVFGIAFGAVALFTLAFFLNASFGISKAEALRCDPDDSECIVGLKACNDEEDNDNDGKIDFPTDPGCTSGLDNNETNGACANGVDDDGDGAIDYPQDTGCTAASDINEFGTAQCDDGLDNDSDSKIDYRSNGTGDLGCSSLTDTTELQPNRTLTINIPAQEESFDNYAKGQVTVSGQSTCASGVCTYSIPDSQTIQLTAEALVNDAGNTARFTGWSGDCSGSSASISVLMDWTKNCTASFHMHGAPYPTSHTFTIRNTGDGSGTAKFFTQGAQTTCNLAAGGSCVYTMQDDQTIQQVQATPASGSSVSYPNPNESCFQDGNVFIQTTRNCTVNFALNSTPSCSSVVPNPATTSQTITFTAANTGSGAWSWSAPGSQNEQGGNSPNFVTSYTTIGTKTVTVTRGGVSGTCNVTVSSGDAYVTVQSNRDTNIAVTGPTPQSNSSYTANTPKTFTPSSPGSYSVVPQSIPGYTYVIRQCNNATCSQTLSAGGQITFNVDYTAIPPNPDDPACSPSSSPVAPNTNTTFTASNMTGPYTWSFPGAYYMSGNVTTAQSSYTVQYPSDGVYYATVSGGGETAECSVTVGTGTPPPPATGLALDFYVTSPANGIYGSTVGPITIAYGTNINLEWVSSEVSPTGCVASGDWSGSKTRNTYASEAKGPLTTPSPKIYTLRCYGNGTYGEPEPYIEKSITVNVATTNKCTLNVTSNAATTWSFTGPTPPAAVTASSTSGGPYIVDPGTYTIVPATLGGGYTGPTVAPAASQVCSAGATVNYALTYTPPAATTVDIKANGFDNPPAIVKGNTAALTWSTANIVPGSCTASNGWSGAKADSGSATSNALNADATFTLTCTSSSSGASVADSVTVPVRESQCNDGVDNDGDTHVDDGDPGCGDDDDDEQNENPECSDGIDNTDAEDGLSDVSDPGCSTNGTYDPNDTNEQNDSTIITECNDGLDNDGDGEADGDDAGCADDNDSSELDEPDIREI
ncbi:MAG: hypothetical protein KBD16_01435 [Candidatus Pacebacteria bacterium]|nr:hypothetical protein [Candidatus Paceibacterota bacterium]